MRSRRLAIFAALILAVLPVYAQSASLSPSQKAWLEEVDAIITDDERQAFAGLLRSYQREAFIARFWHERDPRPETAQNEFLDLWTQRASLATEQFGGLESDRARTMLLLGLPELILPELCPELFRPAEAWRFASTESFPDGFFLIFVERRDDPATPWVLWSPAQGFAPLVESTASSALETDPPNLSNRCTREHEAAEALARAIGWKEVSEHPRLLLQPPAPWVDEFLERTTDVSPEAPGLKAAMRLTFPGHEKDRTVTQVEITIPSEMVTPTAEEPAEFHLRIDGEILRRDTLFDRFRYDFEVPIGEVQDSEIPLAFQRALLPGSYTLVLRLVDRTSGAAFRSEGDLQVPRAMEIGETVDPSLAEANAVLGTGDHVVKIRPLPEQLLTGRVRVEAEAQGENIARIAFVLNDRLLMSKIRPPFSLEIDLGRAPRLHWLEAIALDPAGEELARDRVPVNAGPHSFAIRLVEPRSNQRYISSLRAAAEIHLPAGEKLDRVDFYLNEDRQATLYQPPFVQPLLLPQSLRITYVRAVAYLADGNATEDLVFVNAPGDMARLRINMVELFTTVLDTKKRPVDGLSQEDFRVREEGTDQEIRRFERVEDMSIHAGVIIDASTSMKEELQEALDGALRFFEDVIEPKDRAAVVVFNDEPMLRVPFTNRLAELSAGLIDVESEGETALYDTLVFTLHYFAGIRGKRALILLSDGEDSSSRYQFNETLEFAQRSGAAIYTIGLGLDRRQMGARSVLIQLAKETGGQFFSITSPRELGEIYDLIEHDLRSQYLLAYQSTHEEGGDFRRVEVQVTREGLKAKTIPGYYP